MVGYLGISKITHNAPLIKSLPNDHEIIKYLSEPESNKEKFLQITTMIALFGYSSKKIFSELFLALFEYCEKNSFSIFTAICDNSLKVFYKLINFIPTSDYQVKNKYNENICISFYLSHYKNITINHYKNITINCHNNVANKIFELKNTDIYQNNAHSFDIMNQIANILPTLMFWIDTEGICLGMNDFSEKFLGATKDKFIGKYIYDVLPKEVAQKLMEHNNLVMLNEIQTSEEEQINDLTTGQPKTFLTTKKPLYDENGAIIGVVGVSVDTTAEKQKLAVQDENKKLLEENQNQKQLKKLAHELQHLLSIYKIDILNSQLGIRKNDQTEPPIELNKRQSQILYFLSLGKSPKEIALLLTKMEKTLVVLSTISSIINKQLYIKFNVHNVSELLEKATKLNAIPFSL